LKDAQTLNGKRRYQQALERAGLALQIAPDFGEAQVLKQQIEQRLGARASKLAQLLGTARQAIAEQRFTPPAKNDADTALRSVLKIDAGNTVARQLLAELPQRIVTAAASLARDDANAAVVMVASARKVFPQNAALTGLAARLQKQLAAEKIAARDRAAQQRIEDVLSNASQTTAQLHAGVKDLQVLLADQPGARETQGLRSRLIGAIGSRIKAATAHDEFDALADLLKRESGTLSADASYAPLVSGLPALRTTLLKVEQARAAAERGQLVLNAYPWGRVESVLDANRKPVALPADRTTPLILTLPAGSYVVSFRHPKVGKAIRLIAKVKARERTITSAAFSTITAKDYFARAQ